MLENMIKVLGDKSSEAKKTLTALLDQYGGVSGLITALRAPENQEKIKTWIEDGKEFIASHEQVKKVIGDERLQKIAEAAKVAPEKVSAVLGEVLPQMMQKLEALGNQIPADSLVGRVAEKVTSKLKIVLFGHK